MRELDEDTALSIVFANTKRKKRSVDLIAIAESCEYLAGLHGSQEAVAKRVGLHSEMIRQFLSLLRLPEEVKSMISKRQIDRLDVAYRISMLKDPAQQIVMAKSVADIELSKDIRDVVRLAKEGSISVEESTRTVMNAKPKGLHIVVVDFDDKAYRALKEEAKKSGIGAAQLVKQLVDEWLTRARKLDKN